MISTKFKDSEIIATVALVHGFAENQNISFFEAAMMYAANGFEVVMIDLRGLGYSSGGRGATWTIFDNHESIGVMLKKIRTDKPLFLQGHSMGCMAIQTFLNVNPGLNIAAVIYGAPFFEFHPAAGAHSLANKIKAAVMGKDNEELVVNAGIPVQWVCHDKNFFRKMTIFDARAVPFTSVGCIGAWHEAINDIKHFAPKHTLPTLVLTAGKDKIVDNTGARTFFSQIKTPNDLKVMRLFYNAYHQIQKEPQYKTEFFSTCFDFITKVINKGSKVPSQLNWKPITSFKAGRPQGAPKLSVKGVLFKMAVAAYLAFGFLLWLFLKIFSKNRKLYPFTRVFLCWPIVFKAFFNILKNQQKKISVF